MQRILIPLSIWKKVLCILPINHPITDMAFKIPIDGLDSPEAEARRNGIIKLAMEELSDDMSIDSDATLSEGDDNGCYVQTWQWVCFADTPYDKEVPTHKIFDVPIDGTTEAEALLDFLFDHGLSFHPDDDPAEIANNFTPWDCDALHRRMDEIHSLPDFDPCAHYLRRHLAKA